MTRTEARNLFYEMTEGKSLRRHARTVELVMEALAKKFDEDVEKFAITGLLHDADYEKYPEDHPNVIVEKLNKLGEKEIAHAIAGHYTKWNVPRNSLLDKCIIAADEITGFIVAAALIRPTKIDGMKVKSVMKKFKTIKFAATVDREECLKGAELIGMELRELIEFIISVLQENKEELDLI
ncbi:MAG: HD domain-containing protein [Saprospiraceae bacterium]|nr:HD domain-containing protein [Saprospiraceae bacterium]|tara:strand:- start:28 stop:570 length:543 start_codon:yes stop_codon:yes gene_type:complete